MGNNVSKAMQECKKDGSKRLTLDNCSLKDLPKNTFKEFPGLVYLSLNQNQLLQLPLNISTFKELEVLKVEENRMTSLPASITTLSNLKEIDFVSNELRSIPDDIEKLSKLNKVVFQNNRLKAVPEGIGRLPELKLLYLAENDITTLPLTIGNLEQLTILSLYENMITELPKEIGQLSSLTSLNVSSNKLTTIPAEIGNLTGLIEFFTFNNQLTELPAEIGSLEALNLIDVSENKIKIIPSEIGQCTELRQCNFAENELSELPDSIGNCDQLEMLKVSHNKIVSLPTTLQELVDLKELHVEDNLIEELQSELDEVIENLLIFATDGNPFHSKIGVPIISPAEFEEVVWVMLCAGGVFKKYNRKGKTVNRLVYLDHKTMRLQCRDAKRDRDERDSIPIDKLQEVHVGIKTATLKKYGKSYREDCYFSLVSPTVTLDLEASSPEIRDEWTNMFKQTITHYREHPVVFAEGSNPLSPGPSRKKARANTDESGDSMRSSKRMSILGVVGTIGKKKKKRSGLGSVGDLSDDTLSSEASEDSKDEVSMEGSEELRESPGASPRGASPDLPRTTSKKKLSKKAKNISKKNLRSKDKKSKKSKLAQEVDVKSSVVEPSNNEKESEDQEPSKEDTTLDSPKEKDTSSTANVKDSLKEEVTSGEDSTTMPVAEEESKVESSIKEEPEVTEEEPVKEEPKKAENHKEPATKKEEPIKEESPVAVAKEEKASSLSPASAVIVENSPSKSPSGPTRAKIAPKASILSRLSIFEQNNEEPAPVISRRSPGVARPVSMYSVKSPVVEEKKPTRAAESPVVRPSSVIDPTNTEKPGDTLEIKKTYGGQTSAGNVRSRLAMFETIEQKAQREAAVLKGQRLEEEKKALAAAEASSDTSDKEVNDSFVKEAEEKVKEEADRKAKEEAEKKEKEVADRKAKEEFDHLAKEEEDRKAKEVADMKAKEEADRKAKEEEERKVKEEADRKAKEEADKKAKEEVDRKAKEEEDRKVKEEADCKAKEEADKKAKEEIDRLAKEEEERKKMKTEEEKKAFEEKTLKEKEEREKKEEEERKVQQEVDRVAKEEADKKAKEEQERKVKEEVDRLAKEEADRIAKEEADKKAKEEVDKKEKEAADKAREEADKKAKEEADKKEKEEADKKAKEEADKKATEEAKEAAELKAKEADKKAREEADKNDKEAEKSPKVDETTKEIENDETGKLTPTIVKRAGGVAGRRLPTRRGGGKLASEAANRLQEADERREKQMEEIARRREENMKLLQEEEEKLAQMTPEERQALEDKEKAEQKKREEEDYADRLAREEKEREEQKLKDIEKQKVMAIQGALGSLKKAESRKRVEPPSRLMMLKGKRRVRVHLVEVSAKSLNHGDVFILDKKTTLYIWNGKKANRMEKAKAAEISLRFKNQERKGAAIVRIDPGDTDEEFWKELGGTEADVQTPEEGGNDIDYERDCDSRVKLLRVERNEDGDGDEYTLEEVETKRLSRETLATDGCFILDCQTELFVWVGKGSSSAMRTFTMSYAKANMLEERPDWTHFARNVEGGEEILFREKFAEWPDVVAGARGSSSKSSGGKQMVRRRSMLMGRIKKKEVKIDVNKLHTAVRTEQELLGDGTPGTIEAWIGIDGKLTEENDLLEGNFYSAESYVILYTFHKGNALRYHIYFWQGLDATKQDKGLTALLVKEIQAKVRKEKGAEPFQERVTPLKEPYQFLTIFNGKFKIHKGRKADHNAKNTHFYRVQTTTEAVYTRAIEIPIDSSLMNSRDTFFVQTSSKQIIWYGSGTSEDQKQRAAAIMEPTVGTRTVKIVNEGSEDKKFWKLVGGKKTFANAAHLKKKGWEPRFYYCTGTGNDFKAEPVWEVIQQDLEPTCAMIVDVIAEVYVWTGPSCPEETKKKAMETATEYVRAAFDGRLQNTPIYFVASGQESNAFICLFAGWSDKKQRGEGKLELVSDKLADYDREYTWEELTAKDKPKGLDYKHLEKYLPDSVFEEKFGMTKEKFWNMASWKRTQKKKKIGFF